MTIARTRKAPSLLQLAGTLEVCAAEPADATKPDARKDRAFRMEGYTGADMNLSGYKMAFDLSGMTAPASAYPALREHDRNRIAGRVDATVIDAKGVHISGVLYAGTEHGDHIADLADKKHPWQASMRWAIQAGDYEWVDDDEKASVNGREFTGPGLIARKSHIREASICTLGADGNTNTIAAALDGASEIEATTKRRKTTMAAATKAELQAAFPDPEDKEFILDQRDAEATLEQAQIAHGAVLAGRLKEAKAALAAAKIAPPVPAPKAPSVRGPVAVGASAPLGAPSLDIAGMIAAEIPEGAGPHAFAFHEALAAFKAKGLTDGAARAAISKQYPAIQMAYLNEVNKRPDAEWDRFPMLTAMGPVRR